MKISEMRGAYFLVSHSEASGNWLISRNKKVTLHAMSISHADIVTVIEYLPF